MIHAIAAAALAGLLGSPHCVGMCGSFALACGGRAAHTAAWNAGRTLTYAALGALAGLAGESVPGPTWLATALSAALVIWFAAALAGLAPDPALRIPGIARLATRAATRADLSSRLVFGMANGLLPCGLVYAALGIAVASGDPLTGALAMTAFGLGTTPALAVLALGVRRMVQQRSWIRRAVAAVVLVAGLWVIAQRHGQDPAVGHGSGGDTSPASDHTGSARTAPPTP